MLRNCYGCLGWGGTSAGEVHRQARYSGTQGHARAAHIYARAQVYTRVGKLESCELQAGPIYAREDKLESYTQEEEKDMFYVVDEQDIYINEFTTHEAAEKFCEKWNTSLRFNEWGEPKAHIMGE